MTDGAQPAAPAPVVLSVGDPAPDFTLPASGGGTVSLADLTGKIVVLYFYPKDSTPGCTREAIAFRDALPEFEALGAQVIGVSRDSLKSHDAFTTKQGLTFPLASDGESVVCDRYGVRVYKMLYGKISLGIERATFLIDREGVLRGIWRKVKVDGHVEKVLAAARALT
ncbi:peroxiredoxin [Pararhodospirillum photometricum]|uniref:thioredoxin-dependent peroxiredoxin n=1 Tax=Pararhodospirillum photometricum DSM 122 TaxID=1150469 RepID=H6SLQ5_PARPM|nr:peroxiredoxin [Pararhodospirillum photometricum]CCG08920.1 Glutamate-ammonia-ligase adenylyltransferase [Pararhodospirillum photometricum DSM 122]